MIASNAGMLFRFEHVVTGLSVPRSARREAGLCSGERVILAGLSCSEKFYGAGLKETMT